MKFNSRSCTCEVNFNSKLEHTAKKREEALKSFIHDQYVGPDHYRVLGLNASKKHEFTEEVIRKACRRFEIFSHPDRGGSKEYFVRVQQAYEEICKELKIPMKKN
eukprot:TRINITY_DN56979_c0_g1_i1.p1 TRINITY_DN56979_c0_g1~~TRINITY_DN56979_c0_g1_i1.p1  ORF type:complete len:105 (+),score=16.84 TRINITY_DN56979_c0_g1_i1:43-357(+)